MNEFAKKIFVLFKIAVPKSNKHKSSILQVGLNSSFTQPLDPRFWISYAKPDANEVLLGPKRQHVEETARYAEQPTDWLQVQGRMCGVLTKELKLLVRGSLRGMRL